VAIHRIAVKHPRLFFGEISHDDSKSISNTDKNEGCGAVAIVTKQQYPAPYELYVLDEGVSLSFWDTLVRGGYRAVELYVLKEPNEEKEQNSISENSKIFQECV
jgi:hypothetical protein